MNKPLAWIPKNATLQWSDEFVGSSLSLATNASLNTGTWRCRMTDSVYDVEKGYSDYAGSSWNIAPAQHPNNSPFSVNSSVLTITVRRNPGTLSPAVSNTWLSGILTSNFFNNKTVAYGYVEYRIALPDPIRGMFPAMWLYNASVGRVDGKQGAEMDPFEIFGDATGRPFHAGGITTPVPGSGYRIPGYVRLSGEDNGFHDLNTSTWHRYGIEWTPNKIEQYVDGVSIGVALSSTSVNAAKWFRTALMSVVINYAMDPQWETGTSPRKSQTNDPAIGTESRMLVDYVRVYDRKPDNLPTGSSDPLSMGGPNTV